MEPKNKEDLPNENVPEVNFDEDDKNNKSRIAIGVLAVLLVASLIYIVFSVKARNDLEEKEQLTQQELVETSARLEAISIELDQKIEEIEKLGGDVEELKLAKEQVEQEKEQLRRSSNVQISRLRQRVQGYETLLKNKDEEIAHLKEVNETLLTENTELKTQQNEMQATLSTLEEDKGKLEEQVAHAARLKAENIRVYAVNKRGKEREGEFKGRQIEKLKMAFGIEENDVAPIEGKDIMVRIIEPEGNVLFDVATGSGTFMVDGKEEFYTAKQEILFDNTRQQLTFLYEKPSEFSPGNYTLEIYTDDYLMGSKNFTVK
ncbi:chromosome segregation protein SMC [Fulvivirgaceae bacterium BMA10]|uniref:Chromosome segregation protein SMC n=1 Tax=Splendidivirga corallicola TaxID=3051826 RepID=A0ABT8KGX1_9BACT|nr:chromosome segregation protein SMC [Fulvivirgaceae bacterium BMA10]